MLKELYRLPTWKLNATDTVIFRADCNVPSDKGIILDDARLKSIIPTLKLIQETGAHSILLTHWGRPKQYDPFLSTQHLTSWFKKHGIKTKFIDSPMSLSRTPIHADLIICENIRFLDTLKSEQWIAALGYLGTYFVHDGFSVMHRDDLFNTKLPLIFKSEKRSLGSAAYAEIERLDNFMTHIQKPMLGIFGGAKLDSKINTIQTIAIKYLDSLMLLPALCFPFFKKHGTSIGASYTDATNPNIIALFEKTLATHAIKLLLPIDVLVTKDPNNYPPYTSVLSSEIKATHKGITIGPKTIAMLLQQIDTTHAIIINGLAGFLEIPESLEPMHTLLKYICTSQIPCLIAGGDTYAVVQKLGLTKNFPHYALAGGAALDYCAGISLPGLKTLA